MSTILPILIIVASMFIVLLSCVLLIAAIIIIVKTSNNKSAATDANVCCDNNAYDPEPTSGEPECDVNAAEESAIDAPEGEDTADCAEQPNVIINNINING